MSIGAWPNVEPDDGRAGSPQGSTPGCAEPSGGT